MTNIGDKVLVRYSGQVVEGLVAIVTNRKATVIQVADPETKGPRAVDVRALGFDDYREIVPDPEVPAIWRGVIAANPGRKLVCVKCRFGTEGKTTLVDRTTLEALQSVCRSVEVADISFWEGDDFLSEGRQGLEDSATDYKVGAWVITIPEGTEIERGN
jgi:hypothetical protein